MAILQSLFLLITKSAGKILNAVFGWAVRALFGQSSERDQVFLTGLVGAAVAWPLLVAGVLLPKVAALVLALVPIPHWVPSWTIRLLWLALSLAVPLALGLAVAAKGTAARASEPFWMRMLRGFPITLALAGAFLIMFVSVPVMRIAALLRKEKSGDVPLVTDAAAYHQVAETTVKVLNQHGFDLRASQPGWWVSAPTRLLSLLGGDAFRSFVPQTIEHYVSEGLQISFYTSGVLVKGQRKKVSWAQGLIAELVVRGDGLQTYSLAAQGLERLIRRVCLVHDVVADNGATRDRLLQTVDRIARRLGGLDVDFDEWQVLYRQLMQAERVVRGQRQLMEAEASAAPEGRAQSGAWDHDTRPDVETDGHGAARRFAAADGVPG